MGKHTILLSSHFLFSFLLCFGSLFSQPEKRVDKAAITKLLYQHASDDSPGMAVGIVRNGAIRYEHYMGFANLEHSVKVDENTRFNIASCAKQFTALCILTLIDKGEVKLDDDLRKYLPDLYPEIQAPITLSNLLSHTSGIRDVYDLWSLQGKTWYELFLGNGDAMELLQAQTDLNFEPGAAHLYSNSNYILLTEIVRAVTGQSFSEYATSVFEKLDMKSTGFLTNYMAVMPHKARPYGNWGGWKEYPAITELHGDGALFTTLKDQLQWEKIVQNNDGRYLSKTLIDQSQARLERDYGFGLFFDQKKETEYIYHDGSTGAYQAMSLRFPKDKISIVVMSNNGSVPATYLAWQIADLFYDLEEPVVYPAGPDEVEPLTRIGDATGIYKREGEDGSVIRIMEKNDSLYREMYQRAPVNLIPEKAGLFSYKTIPDLKMNFTNIGKPDQQFTLYKDTQKPATFTKVSDLDFDGFDRNDLNGRFFNAETKTEVVIQYDAENTYTLVQSGEEIEATLILKDYLRVMDAYQVYAVRDQDDQVIGLRLDGDRIKNVFYRKVDETAP